MQRQVAKKAFRTLKTISVIGQDYELAAELRTMELELFPETEEEKTAKKQAKDLEGILKFFGIKTSLSNCYIILEAVKKYNELGTDFSIKDSVKIELDAEKYFEHENN